MKGEGKEREKDNEGKEKRKGKEKKIRSVCAYTRLGVALTGPMRYICIRYLPYLTTTRILYLTLLIYKGGMAAYLPTLCTHGATTDG